jgi:hypothetical protein
MIVELEEIKTLWAAGNEKHEASARLNRSLLQRWNLRKVDTSLKWRARSIGIELLGGACAMFLLGSFAADHILELRFAAPAIALGVYAIALIIANARQLAAVNAVDFDEPVVAIQKRLARLRIARIRTIAWTLLFAPLMWVPLLVVAARAVFGVDVYAAGGLWLLANLLFGLAVIPIAIGTAHLLAARSTKSRGLRSLGDLIAGRTLASALESLDSVVRFEGDDYSVSTGRYDGR